MTPSNPATWANTAFPLCLLLGVALLLGGCKQEPSAAAGSGGPSGVYTLVTVNGNKLPATVAHDGVSLEIRSGSFSINADGTCSSRMTFVPPSGKEAVREVVATYTRDGVRLVMKWKGAGTTKGTLVDGTFTMNNEGMVLVYEN